MNDVVSAAAAVAFMHPDDIGKLFVPSSTRRPLPLVPEYSQDEDGAIESWNRLVGPAAPAAG